MLFTAQVQLKDAANGPRIPVGLLHVHRVSHHRVGAVDNVSHSLEHYANFTEVDDSAPVERKSQPRERQSATTKVTKLPAQEEQMSGKQSRVVCLSDIPVRIITKILSHLIPIDIISLARSIKPLRKMLMRRSSVHIWRVAMDNISGLPECPPEMKCMSKRAWLDLVFPPESLTKPERATLKPVLVGLLKADRKRRLEVGCHARKQEWQARLSELFRDIKKQGTMTIQVSSPDSKLTGLNTVSYEPPFPDFAQYWS
ncbi:unnamed protein product [Rhizoctonia solani]|uniref:F-box domain-containing protein n=1 Tax=Rhizoctonia solani TaxID=456999 RepID=A0A8H3CSX7_9AGAM|nr:unnamed protein product [Rhizoctonia solani]